MTTSNIIARVTLLAIHTDEHNARRRYETAFKAHREYEPLRKAWVWAKARLIAAVKG